MKWWTLATTFLLCLPVGSMAQLCNQNLGDPIVNITFGNGDNYPVNNTTYSYVTGCPSKGEYTISDFLFGCGGNWNKLTGDHTGGLKGNYMLVNAESTPGIVHQDTAFGLCGNMTYQYTAFVTSVMRLAYTCDGNPVLPNLTFSVESISGIILASYNTGDIPVTDDKLWKQYGLVFTTPPGTSTVILKIKDSAAYGCGNAFAIDDIVFQNCGPEVNVTIDGSIADQNVCADYTNPFIMKGGYSAGFTNPAIQWQNSLDSGNTWKDIPGQTTTMYAVPHRISGVILYRMVVAEKQNINSVNCRIRSNAIYTNIHPLAAHTPLQDIMGCTGRDYALPESDPKALDILWTGTNSYNSVDPKSIIPNLQFSDTGLYKLKEIFYFGCTSLDSFRLQVSPGITLAAQPSHPLCEGGSETLSTSASAAGTFKWTPATGLSNDAIPDPVASPKDSMQYKVIVTNTWGCQDSAFLSIHVYRLPFAAAGPDKLIVSGDTSLLNGSIKGTAVHYYWSPQVTINDISAIQPKVYPTQVTSYTLHTVSTVGCGSVSDDVVVKVYNDFFIPDSFTPNGDGINDVFRVLPYDNYTINRFIIYNRWGGVVFNSADIYKGWDGNYKGLPQPGGIYVFYMDFKNTKGKDTIKRGTVLLLR
ncbi:MAG: gliding motility-associated C-terminal domain-containing protein [Ginsengibacter sp.]